MQSYGKSTTAGNSFFLSHSLVFCIFFVYIALLIPVSLFVAFSACAFFSFQVETLKRENDHLKEELVLETRQANQSSSMNNAAQIAKLQVG